MTAAYTPIRLTGLAAQSLPTSGLRVVITGASGWLGMATLEMLAALGGGSALSRVRCFGSRARALRLMDGTIIEQQPLARMGELRAEPTLLLHYAFLTRDKVGQQPLATYVADNRSIASQVEEHASSSGVTHAFIASSGAVYGPDRKLASDLTANPYGVLKLEDEARFTQWAGRNDAALTIARVFNLSGPYVNKTSTYALAALILDALANRPFAIRARHPVVRSYAAISQVVSTAIGALLSRDVQQARPWDTAGEREVELAELAVQIAQELRIEGRIERPNMVAQPIDRYVGQGADFGQMQARLGVAACALPAQILQTAAYLGAGQPVASTR